MNEDEQAVRRVHAVIQITKPVKFYPFWAAYSASNEFLGRGASELLMWADARVKLPAAVPVANLDELLRNVRSATPEELTAQRESYGKNYKPGPIQATPFMPEAYDHSKCPGCQWVNRNHRRDCPVRLREGKPK